jgi:hypothetical protein
MERYFRSGASASSPVTGSRAFLNASLMNYWQIVSLWEPTKLAHGRTQRENAALSQMTFALGTFLGALAPQPS